MAGAADPTAETFRVGGPPSLLLIPVLCLFVLVETVFWTTVLRDADLVLGVFLTVWTLGAASAGYRFLRAPRRIELEPGSLRFVRSVGGDVEVPWSALLDVSRSRSGWRWSWTDGRLVMPFPPAEGYRLLRAIEERAPHVQLHGM